MFTFDEFEEKVFDISEEIPDEFYANLTGGIVVNRACKVHPKSVGRELCIMGEYCVRSERWRYIVIYYGSFVQQYASCDDEYWVRRIREVLEHELKHHWESQAGFRDLEEKDKVDLQSYLNKKKETGFFGKKK